MGNNFSKLKIKYILAAALKSAVLGISCGLFVVGVVMLSLKLSAVAISFLYYILIGVGTAALAGALSFVLFYRPGLTDKKVAKRIDNDYGLKERVQTVVEYGEEQSDVLTLLKEDTENLLANLPKRKTTFFNAFSKIWYLVVSSVLSVAIAVPALCVPARTKPNPDDEQPPVDITDDDPAFEYSLEFQALMYDLMRDILNSNLLDTEKDGIYNILDDLNKNVLPSLKKQSEVDIAIKTAVYAVDGVVNAANSFRTVSEALKEFDKNLAKAIEQGVILYKTFKSNLIDLDMTKGLYNRVNANIDEALENYFNSSYEEHKFTEITNADGDVVPDGAVVYEYKENLASAISSIKQSGVAEDDGLCVALTDFRQAIEAVYTKYSKKGVTAASLNEGNEESLSLAYDPTLKTAATDAMLVQSYNCIMDLYVRQRLSTIFGVSLAEIGELNDDLTPESNKTDDDFTTGGDATQGGFGSGEEIFGSKDLIYDPDLREQVEYGKVFSEYYSKVDDRIKSGELSQELVDFIEEYFKILLNGTKTENSVGE